MTGLLYIADYNDLHSVVSPLVLNGKSLEYSALRDDRRSHNYTRSPRTLTPSHLQLRSVPYYVSGQYAGTLV